MPHYNFPSQYRSHGHWGLGRELNQQLTALANSGPVGLNQAVRLIQKLAATSDGMAALKHAFQHNQTNLEFARARAGSSYSIQLSDGGAMVLFGDGKHGKRLPASRARKIAASYQYGSGKKR